MVDKLFSIPFILTIIALTLLEKKRLGSILTPFTVSAWPFIGIVITNNFFLGQLQFLPITTRSQLFILINLIIIWIAGYILSFRYANEINQERRKISAVFDQWAEYQILFLIFSWIAILVTFFKVYGLMQSHSGFDFFTEQEFEDTMVKGIAAHFTHIGEICFVFLMVTLKKVKHKIYSIITLIGLFLAVAIVQVKYHLIWIILITFFYSNLNKDIKSQVKNIAKIGIVVLLTMNMFWIFLLIIWGSIGTSGGWDFLVKHSFDYFVSGPIVLEHWLNLGNTRPDWTMLTVPLNLFYVLTGNPLRINATPLVSGAFFEVAPGVISNVGTSFGVYYMIGGFFFTIFMTTLVSIISYHFYYKSLNTKSTVIIFINLLLLTINTLCFFGQYFTTLSPYENIALFVILIMILKLISQIRTLLKLS